MIWTRVMLRPEVGRTAGEVGRTAGEVGCLSRWGGLLARWGGLLARWGGLLALRCLWLGSLALDIDTRRSRWP
jgi:hypothetical protein